MGYKQLSEEIKRGIEGKNNGIPMGFKKLSKYMGIRKKIYTLMFGSTGSGKTAFVHDAFILNPFEHYLKIKKNSDDIKFKVILFSMERSKIYIIAKWMSRKIFIETGTLIPIQKMLGWWDTKLTKDEQALIESFEWYINELLQVIDIVEGAQNPTGIYKYVKNYAEENGTFKVIDEYTKKYIPHHPNEIVIVIEDHLGLTKMEKGQGSKKEAIDKVSEYNQWFRDTLGYSPVAVTQITRNLSNPIHQKMDSFEPTLDDSKESGRPPEDADVVISIFDPIRFKTNDSAYKVNNFIDPATGGNFFRSIKILKNTYGEDSIKQGMAFQGATGLFAELPRSKEMEDFSYEELFNGKYFLKI